MVECTGFIHKESGSGMYIAWNWYGKCDDEEAKKQFYFNIPNNKDIFKGERANFPPNQRNTSFWLYSLMNPWMSMTAKMDNGVFQ